ncbi:MAG TPA: coproporphyrinogen III oxidase, partial [Ruminococcaceae bacterium]|nr:coproporphyrinogen III oxidase [Oscillospiraceae bacterium]
YARALARLLRRKFGDRRRKADTLYFGGGTPPLLGAENLAALIREAKRDFGLSDAEITVEVNPAQYPPDFFEKMARAGVTRLSIGLQSADDGELRLLGRRHTAAQARQAVR